MWFCDERIIMRTFGKQRPLTKNYFADLKNDYVAENRSIVKDERWVCFNRKAIAKYKIL